MIGTGVKILADGGDIPDTNYAGDTDGWRGGNGGGGSGGAIRLSANNITNNGLLSATGGDRYHPTYGGAGGGGRIAMIARKALVPGQYDISGGRNTEGDIIAGDGTIYVEAGEGGMSVLNAPSGSLVIDGSGGSILYSGPVGSGLAFGQVEDKILAVDGVDVPYSVSTFIFDSITIGSATVVQVKGNSGVLLKTRNHGSITIDATISVDGLADSTAGPGGFKGGAGGSSGEGPGAGTNLSGSGGSYAGAGEGEALPVLYGDAKLASLIGGSGGAGVGSDVGGGGAGAFGLEANGTGDITIGSTGVLSARGGGSAVGAGSGGAIYLKGMSLPIMGSSGQPVVYPQIYLRWMAVVDGWLSTR